MVTARARTATLIAGRSRRTWVVIVLAVTLIIGATSAVSYAASYSPLQPAGWGGPSEGAPDRLTGTDPQRISGSAGAEVELMFGIWNNGSVAIHIDGVELNSYLVNARWTPYRFHPGSYISGDPLPPRDFGATMQSQGRLRILLTVRQPDCTKPSNVGLGFDGFTVRWHSMGLSHKTSLAMTGGADGSYLSLCGIRAS